MSLLESSIKNSQITINPSNMKLKITSSFKKIPNMIKSNSFLRYINNTYNINNESIFNNTNRNSLFNTYKDNSQINVTKKNRKLSYISKSNSESIYNNTLLNEENNIKEKREVNKNKEKIISLYNKKLNNEKMFANSNNDLIMKNEKDLRRLFKEEICYDNDEKENDSYNNYDLYYKYGNFNHQGLENQENQYKINTIISTKEDLDDENDSHNHKKENKEKQLDKNITNPIRTGNISIQSKKIENQHENNSKNKENKSFIYNFNLPLLVEDNNINKNNINTISNINNNIRSSLEILKKTNNKLYMNIIQEKEKEEASIFLSIIGILSRKYSIGIKSSFSSSSSILLNVLKAYSIKLISESALRELSILGSYKKIINKRKQIEDAYLKETNQLKIEYFNINQEIGKYEEENKKLFKINDYERREILHKKSKLKQELEGLRQLEKGMILSFNLTSSSSLFSKLNQVRKKISDIDQLLVNLNIDEENLRKNEYSQRINSNIDSIKSLKQKIKSMKNVISFLIDQQRRYYISLLMKGFDMRNEGMIWIIKKLIYLRYDLNLIINSSNFEVNKSKNLGIGTNSSNNIKSIFPEFLHKDNIEYILNISYKHIDKELYILIYNGLKIKQRKLNNIKNKVLQEAINSSPKKKKVISKFHQKSMNKTYFGMKENFNMKKIENSDFSLQNQFYQNENLLIGLAIDKLKRKLITFANDDGVFQVDITNDITFNEYFEENIRGKDYFKEILYIKSKIDMIDKEIHLMKQNKLIEFEEGLKIFKKNFNYMKLIEWELNYVCLFGMEY